MTRANDSSNSSFSLWGLLGDVLYPDKCALCNRVGTTCPCANCLSEFERRDLTLDVPFGILQSATAIYPYVGVAREAVKALKFGRSTALAQFMANEIAEAAQRLGFTDEVFVPVPVHRNREASRGFNQAELLSEALPAERIRSELVRVRYTKPQAVLSPVERATNLVGAFEASPSIKGEPVVLIDDVCTTGSTATECAKALLAAGALSVKVLTFAGNP